MAQGLLEPYATNFKHKKTHFLVRLLFDLFSFDKMYVFIWLMKQYHVLARVVKFFGDFCFSVILTILTRYYKPTKIIALWEQFQNQK